jgi:hypothetical protein
LPIPCSISVASNIFMTDIIPNVVYKHLREKKYSCIQHFTGNSCLKDFDRFSGNGVITLSAKAVLLELHLAFQPNKLQNLWRHISMFLLLS